MSTMHELNEWITLDEYRSMTSTLTDAWSVIEMAATSTTNYYSGTSGMATGDHPEWMYSAWDNYGTYMTPPYETTTTGGDTWTVSETTQIIYPSQPSSTVTYTIRNEELEKLKEKIKGLTEALVKFCRDLGNGLDDHDRQQIKRIVCQLLDVEMAELDELIKERERGDGSREERRLKPRGLGLEKGRL